MKKQNFLTKLTFQKSKRINALSKLWLSLGIAVTSLNAFAEDLAGSTGLPAEAALTAIQKSISGPIAISVATVLIVATGLMNAFGEWGDGMKKLLNVGFWVSIAFGVTSLLTTFGNTAT